MIGKIECVNRVKDKKVRQRRTTQYVPFKQKSVLMPFLVNLRIKYFIIQTLIWKGLSYILISVLNIAVLFFGSFSDDFFLSVMGTGSLKLLWMLYILPFNPPPFCRLLLISHFFHSHFSSIHFNFELECD